VSRCFVEDKWHSDPFSSVRVGVWCVVLVVGGCGWVSGLWHSDRFSSVCLGVWGVVLVVCVCVGVGGILLCRSVYK